MPTPDAPLIASLRARILAVVAPLLAEHRGRPAALLDFPAHGNPGDSLLWLAQLALVEELGVPVAYTCDEATYAPAALAARVGDGPILLGGGGNLGDLWDAPGRLRERVLADFPRSRIVQLPQSIHATAPAALDRARRAIGAHRDVVLLVRDPASLRVAEQELGARVVLCPDLAFLVGPLPRPAPSAPVLVLSRRAPATADPGVRHADWVDDEPGPGVAWHARMSARVLAEPALWPHVFAAQAAAARERVARGVRTIAQGEALVTDRLHGHVTALLLGVPHVVVDDAAGKLGGFFDTWTAGARLATRAPSVEEAIARGRQLERPADRSRRR